MIRPGLVLFNAPYKKAMTSTAGFQELVEEGKYYLVDKKIGGRKLFAYFERRVKRYTVTI